METQQPIDIGVEARKIRKEQFSEYGDQIEGAVVQGKGVFLGEIDRSRLKSLVEGVRVDLSVIEGKADLSAQADQLVLALGRGRLVDEVAEMVAEIANLPGGNVFKGDSVRPENADEAVENFVREYVYEQTNKKDFVFDPLVFDRPEESWKKNAVYRIEAVMSVANKLLWVMQADDEAESIRRQGTNGMLKHLRERIMRGAERNGEVIDSSVQRHPDKIIRHLPPKSVGVILEHLTGV